MIIDKRKELIDLRFPHDTDKLRDFLYQNVKEAFQIKFPAENEKVRVELDKIEIPKIDYDYKTQKQAIMKNINLTIPVFGHIKVIDKKTGQVKLKGKKLLVALPYITNRGTVIYNGNEYAIINQFRLKPGPYTRIKESGEVETHFNILGKPAFRIMFNPDNRKFYFVIGQAKLPLYPILKAAGVDDNTLKEIWGEELLRLNQTESTSALDRFFKRYKLNDVNAILEQHIVDPEVAFKTLNIKSDRVNKDMILAAMKKILRVYRNETDTDNRDSLLFQVLKGPEDYIAERIKYDPANILNSFLFKAASAKDLADLPANAFGKYMEDILFKTGLAMPLEEINPLDYTDQQYRVIRLGEGGIPSVDAVPDEARNVQPSFLGFVDPLRGPESEKLGVDMRLGQLTMKDRQGNLYTYMRNVKTGKIELVPANKIDQITIAFPGEMDSNEKYVVAMRNDRMEYVKKKDVDYELIDPLAMFTITTAMIPVIGVNKAIRLFVAGKMIPQALSLSNREAPLVQNITPKGSIQKLYSTFAGAVTSPVNGRVKKVTKDYIVIEEE